jgi:hypothetical protein
LPCNKINDLCRVEGFVVTNHGQQNQVVTDAEVNIRPNADA